MRRHGRTAEEEELADKGQNQQPTRQEGKRGLRLVLHRFLSIFSNLP